jgi:hypothetical protein
LASGEEFFELGGELCLGQFAGVVGIEFIEPGIGESGELVG